ncbi:MAG: prepilin-type N-terminal cleavage/methylation domain-containing protein [Candidatus Magasanikbacteria bacterium]|nr:prepilin-type N-terminal cleavage/methylation domain-containing protein [Candidatus Magasanikbacteria bacterium]
MPKQKSVAAAGFTLVELLIVIAIIAIIAAVIFVALDPLTRFKDARDSTRWQEVAEVINAIKIDQVDNGGFYLTAVSNTNAGEVYMITGNAVASGCDDNNSNCDVDVTDDDNCVDLSGLVSEGYLGAVPVSPNGTGTWSSSTTGYTLQRDSSGIVTVRACESENTDAIWVAR